LAIECASFYIYGCNEKTKKQHNEMPYKYDDELREDIANRLNGGQGPKGIAESLNLSLRTVYRIKKSFVSDEGMFIAVPVKTKPRDKIDRDKLIQLVEMMENNPKTTLKELIGRAVEKGVFTSKESAPHISSVHRALVRIGMRWVKPHYDDPRASRMQITFERCEFRRRLMNGLVDPESILSTDETSFTVGSEQQTRAWGTMYNKPTLTKNKMGWDTLHTLLHNIIQNN
jgi:transposase